MGINTLKIISCNQEFIFRPHWGNILRLPWIHSSPCWTWSSSFPSNRLFSLSSYITISLPSPMFGIRSRMKFLWTTDCRCNSLVKNLLNQWNRFGFLSVHWQSLKRLFFEIYCPLISRTQDKKYKSKQPNLPIQSIWGKCEIWLKVPIGNSQLYSKLVVWTINICNVQPALCL